MCKALNVAAVGLALSLVSCLLPHSNPDPRVAAAGRRFDAADQLLSPLPNPARCAELLEVIEQTAAACVLDEAMQQREGKICTPIRCPECKRMVDARTEAQALPGCL